MLAHLCEFRASLVYISSSRAVRTQMNEWMDEWMNESILNLTPRWEYSSSWYGGFSSIHDQGERGHKNKGSKAGGREWQTVVGQWPSWPRVLHSLIEFPHPEAILYLKGIDNKIVSILKIILNVKLKNTVFTWTFNEAPPPVNSMFLLWWKAWAGTFL